jgi:hypothetical protein
MDPRIAAWWNDVLAGETDEPHPVLGGRLVVHLKRDRLELHGVLDRREDREEIVRQARARIGHGVREVDASRLRVARRLEKPGLLDQTIIASFADRATAELARRFVLEQTRIKPKHEAIVDAGNAERLRALLPEELTGDVQRRIESGEAVLLLTVDETEAFTIRGLLEEESRSRWTMATPPVVARG